MPRLNSYPTVNSLSDTDTVPVMQNGVLKQVARSNMGLAKQTDLDAHTTNTANPHAVTKAQVGLSNVDNTADTAKPVSTAQQTALNGKANSVHTHVAADVTDFQTSVSANSDVAANTSARHTHANKTVLDNTTASYTTAEQTKLAGIAAGAEQNVNPDWNAVSGDAQILNKPTLGTAAAQNTSAFATAAQGAKADSAVQSVVAGTNVTVDNTDPHNPVISATGGGVGTNATNLSTTQTATNVTVNSDTGTDATIPAADATNAGVMAAADKTKLNGIASGATANQTDSFLLNRANHTGTQTLSTISDAGTAASKNVPATGNAATGEVVIGTDTRLSDARTPTAHTHVESDVIGLTTDLAAKVPTTRTVNGHALSADVTLSGADLSMSDVTTNNASTAQHGFLPKLSGVATQYLDGTGAFSTPAGGGGGGVILHYEVMDYSSTDFWSTGGAGGTIAKNSDVLQLSTGTTSGNSIFLYRQPAFDWRADNFPVTHYGAVVLSIGNGASATGEVYHRWYSSTNAGQTGTGDQIGLHLSVASGTWSGQTSTGDGTTEQAISLSGVTFDNSGSKPNRYAFSYDGITVSFYVNGVLKNSHAANPPRRTSSGIIKYRAVTRAQTASSATVIAIPWANNLAWPMMA